MLNAPTMAGCAPAPNGSTCRVTFGRAVASINRPSCARITFGPPTGRRNTPSSTTTHNRGASTRVSSDCRPIRNATLRSTSSAVSCRCAPRTTERAYASVCSSPGTNCPPRDRQQLRDLPGVGDPVQPQQIDHVALFEADLPVLEPVDLPLRGTDRRAGLLPREAALHPESAQLRADQHPADGRSASRLSLGHVPSRAERVVHGLPPTHPRSAHSVSNCRWRLHPHLAECIIAHGRNRPAPYRLT